MVSLSGIPTKTLACMCESAFSGRSGRLASKPESVPACVIPYGRLQLKCDGTRWRTGGEVKGKLANGVGSQYPLLYLGTWCIQHYYRWWHTSATSSRLNWRPPPDLNGLVRFAVRRNLVSVRVPAHFKRSLPVRHTPAFKCAEFFL